MDVSRGSRQHQEAVPGSTIVLGVFIALLILFLWLHFIVAHENELLGREIQEQMEVLDRIERENMALRRQVAATWAEPVMAERARTLGYQPQQPLYLLLSHPLVPASNGLQKDAYPLPFTTAHVPPAGPGAAVVPGANAMSGASISTGTSGDGSTAGLMGRP